jgi:hypothetical protein
MKLLQLTEEQQRAYDRFIRARDRVKLVRTAKNLRYEWIPHRDYLESYRADGEHHPVFEPNVLWQEYKDAFTEWLRVEPEFRDKERMRMSRGDYGKQDSWEDTPSGVKDVVTEIGGNK